MFGKLLGPDASSADELACFLRSIEDVRGVRVLRLRGPVDASIGPQVQSVIKELEAEGPTVFERPLLFDFDGTTAWDFATVAFLVQALRRRVHTGAGVGIVNAPAPLVAELQIAKLDGLFRVFASEGEALAALAGGDGRAGGGGAGGGGTGGGGAGGRGAALRRSAPPT